MSSSLSSTQSLPWLMLVPLTDLKAHPPGRLGQDPKAYSERDAALECLADLDQGRCRSLRDYARLFGWGLHSGHKRVQRFLQEKLHLRIHWDLPTRSHRFEAISMLYQRFRKDQLLPFREPKTTQPNPATAGVEVAPRPKLEPKDGPPPTQDPYIKPNNPRTCPAKKEKNPQWEAGEQANKGVLDDANPLSSHQPPHPGAMPVDFGWSQDLADWASQRYPDIPLERFRHYVTDVFIPWCRAKGYRYLDFIQACIAWINQELQKPRGGFFQLTSAKKKQRQKATKAAKIEIESGREPLDDGSSAFQADELGYPMATDEHDFGPSFPTNPEAFSESRSNPKYDPKPAPGVEPTIDVGVHPDSEPSPIDGVNPGTALSNPLPLWTEPFDPKILHTPQSPPSHSEAFLQALESLPQYRELRAELNRPCPTKPFSKADNQPATEVWDSFLDFLKSLGIPETITSSLERCSRRWDHVSLSLHFEDREDWLILDRLIRETGGIFAHFHQAKGWLPFPILPIHGGSLNPGN